MKRRLRSILKWGCTATTVLLLVVWVGSASVLVGSPLTDNTYVAVVEGRVEFGWLRPPGAWSDDGLLIETNDRPVIRWWFELRRHSAPPVAGFEVSVPVWVLSAPTGALAMCLWYRDRRRAPGLCAKCGYDLRGTDHVVCPECGAAAPRALKAES